MKGFSANINVALSTQEEGEQLMKLFATEDSSLSNNRASYDLFKEKDKVRFEIKADDAVALRAVTNAICKVLSVFEKMKKV